jgi:uncharacterized protein (TIGR02646 family)
MIRISRSLGSAPAILSGPEARKSHERARRFFNSRNKTALQSQHRFNAKVLDSVRLKAALVQEFGDRCAFCGRSPEMTGGLVAHHLRPPEGAVATDGSRSRRHYWWLAYSWENLYLGCEECRTAQGQKFPVREERARVGSSAGALAREMPLLLDPTAEDPEEVLVYLDTGEVVSGDARAKTTIETFELNRHRLVRDRAMLLERINWDLGQVQDALRAGSGNEVIRQLFKLYDLARPLAALRRQRVNQWVQFRPRKIEAVFDRAGVGADVLAQMVGNLRRITNEVKELEAFAFFGEAAELYLRPERFEGRYRQPEEAVPERRTRQVRERVEPLPDLQGRRAHEPKPWNYLDAAEIRTVEIHNFRAIEHLSLELTDGPGEGSWLMLLGENGTGKSSILQAIALALADSATVENHSKDVGHLLRKGAKEGRIRVELTGRHRSRELRFGNGYDGFEADQPLEGILIAGYGATRLLPRSANAPPSIAKIEGLFDPFVPLSRPSSWLPNLEEEQFDSVARALKRLLNLSERETMRLAGGEIYVTQGKQRLRLADLSDGYQSMAGFGLDLMELFLRRWGSLEAAEGVVLVDELGAHLHPRWQMQVTGLLRSTFPRVQFIATTHDPLCLHGLREGEVALLRRSEDRGVYALHRELPSVEGLAVDQILTSEHFGLHSTRDPQVEALLNEYYRLLTERDRSPRQQHRLERVRSALDSYKLLGATRRERLALEAADAFLAVQAQLPSAEAYDALHTETIERIQSIWEGGLR